LTPYAEGDSPISRKDPADVQIHGMTGGATATLNLYTDDTLSPSTPNMVFAYSLLRDSIFRGNILDLGPFQRVQAEIIGSMTSFSIHALGISCTYRPPHVMALDFSNLIPANNADLAWINQIEFDLQSDYDVLLDVYKGGVLHATETITVTPGIRDVYTVGPLPRETKGRRLGLILRTSQADGEGFLGFECYQIRVRSGTTGNYTELQLGQTDGRSDQ
jgi:hypothetical protein